MTIEQTHNQEFSYESPEKLTDLEVKEKMVFTKTTEEMEQNKWYTREEDKETWEIVYQPPKSEEDYANKEYAYNKDKIYTSNSMSFKKPNQYKDLIWTFLSQIKWEDIRKSLKLKNDEKIITSVEYTQDPPYYVDIFWFSPSAKITINKKEYDLTIKKDWTWTITNYAWAWYGPNIFFTSNTNMAQRMYNEIKNKWDKTKIKK